MPARQAYAPQVCRQLAFWLAKDMTCFDVVSLAYAPVSYTHLTLPTKSTV